MVGGLSSVRRNESGEQHAVHLRGHRPDYVLLVLILLLLTIGVVVVYAIGPALSLANNVGANFFSSRQLIAVLLGVVAFFVTSRVSLKDWQQWTKPLLIIAGLATLVALVMPVSPNYPAHRWIRLGSFSFQSVELLKFAGLIWVSGFLSQRIASGAIKNLKGMMKPLGIAIAIAVTIVAGIQSDFGSTVVMLIMMAAIAFVAGIPLGRMSLIAIALIICGVLLISAVPYRRERLATFLHPTADCQASGYQACQALISVGSGGAIGLGLGRSVQAYGYLPEAANDSIFAIYAEKFGFIGVAILLALFFMLFSRLKRIAVHAPDNFSRLFVIGVLAWLSIQSVINIGAMLGLLPLKGITLPLISYGGTSVVFVMIALGVVFQISRYTSYVNETDGRSSSYADSPNWRRNQRRPRNTELSSRA